MIWRKFDFNGSGALCNESFVTHPPTRVMTEAQYEYQEYNTETVIATTNIFNADEGFQEHIRDVRNEERSSTNTIYTRIN